jgi:hypothetical protein
MYISKYEWLVPEIISPSTFRIEDAWEARAAALTARWWCEECVKAKSIKTRPPKCDHPPNDHTADSIVEQG